MPTCSQHPSPHLQSPLKQHWLFYCFNISTLVKEFVPDLPGKKGNQFSVMLSHKVKATCEIVQAPGQTQRQVHNGITCKFAKPLTAALLSKFKGIRTGWIIHWQTLALLPVHRCLQMSVTQNSTNCTCKTHFSLGAVCQSSLLYLPAPWVVPRVVSLLPPVPVNPTYGQKRDTAHREEQDSACKSHGWFHHHFCRYMCLLVSTLHSFLFSSVQPSSFSGEAFLSVWRTRLKTVESPF